MTASLPGYRILPGMALASLVFVSWFHFSNIDFTYNVSQRPKDLSYKKKKNKLPAVRHGSPEIPSLPSTPILPFKNILWAHIGKAGGNTVRVILSVYCDRERGGVVEECAQAPDSMLSDRIKGLLHHREVLPTHGAVQQADAYLYNLRHPVDRMISWYHYEHPESCMHNVDTKHACATAKAMRKLPDGSASMFYQECFPTQDRFALAFSSSGKAVLGRNCTELARQVIEGQIGYHAGFKHISNNIRYYSDKTVEKYPSKSVLVVRTEHLWDDLKDLDIQLGGKGSFGPFEGSKDTHGSELYRKSNETLSTADYVVFCCAMQEEMHVYRRLLERAVNLDEATKNATITSAAERCGFASWNNMVDACTADKEGFFGMHQVAHNNPGTSLLPASPELSYNNILFVHVGKAGGNTIRVLNRVYCESDRHRIDVGCYESPDSMLSDQVKGFFHSNFFRPMNGAVRKAEAYLFNLRNPVDRMMSWYHYEHPKSCLHNTATRIACHSAIEVEENPRKETALFFQTCFPSQHDFAAAFNSTAGSGVLKRACTDLAQKVVEGRVIKMRVNQPFKPIQGFKHISYNMRYYVNRTLDRFPNKDVIVVRTESMWEDLKDLDIKLGGYGIFGEREGYKDSHGSEKYKGNKDTLSDSEYSLLCCALQDEMDMYRHLLERAVNLDDDIKESTITNTAKRCGFSSWDDMMRQCSIHHQTTSATLLDLSTPSLSYENITFVRVGKTGSALIVILKAFCENHTDIFEAGCYGPDSILSDQIQGYVYGAASLPTEEVIESTNAYLYNVGHPVHHLLSWYHYEHPRSCLPGHEGRSSCLTAKEIQENPQGEAALFFQTCFPTINHLPLAFFRSSFNPIDKKCIELAKEVVEGRIPGNGFKHISYNLRSYVNRTIGQFPQKDVLVVRTESLWDDLKDLDFQLGGSGAFDGMEDTAALVASAQHEYERNTLSSDDYSLLCCAILDEIHAYRRLVEVAANLDTSAKAATYARSVRVCGFSSWNEMVNQCTPA